MRISEIRICVLLLAIFLRQIACAISNCALENSGQCYQCDASYFLSSDGLLCSNSKIGCILYQNAIPLKCLECNSSIGYALSASGNYCFSTVSNCSQYSDTATCLQCGSNFYLSLANICVSCNQPNCKVCNTDGTCQTCINSAYTLNYSGSCACSKGYYPIIDVTSPIINSSICTACQNGCSSCSQTNGVCLTCTSSLRDPNQNCSCIEGYFESVASGECIECDLGTFRHNSVCLSECPEGYYENPQSRICSSCGPSSSFSSDSQRVQCLKAIRGEVKLLKERTLLITLSSPVQIADAVLFSSKELFPQAYIEYAESSSISFQTALVNSKQITVEITVNSSYAQRKLVVHSISSGALSRVADSTTVDYPIILTPSTIILPSDSEPISSTSWILSFIWWAGLGCSSFVLAISLFSKPSRCLSLAIETIQIISCFFLTNSYLPFTLSVTLSSIDASNFRFLAYGLYDSLASITSYHQLALYHHTYVSPLFLENGANYLILISFFIIIYLIISKTCLKPYTYSLAKVHCLNVSIDNKEKEDSPPILSPQYQSPYSNPQIAESIPSKQLISVPQPKKDFQLQQQQDQDEVSNSRSILRSHIVPTDRNVLVHREGFSTLSITTTALPHQSKRNSFNINRNNYQASLKSEALNITDKPKNPVLLEDTEKDAYSFVQKEEYEENLRCFKGRHFILSRIDFLIQISKVPLIFSAAVQLSRYFQVHEEQQYIGLEESIGVFLSFISLIGLCMYLWKQPLSQYAQKSKERINLQNTLTNQLNPIILCFWDVQFVSYCVCAFLAGWMIESSAIIQLGLSTLIVLFLLAILIKQSAVNQPSEYSKQSLFCIITLLVILISLVAASVLSRLIQTNEETVRFSYTSANNSESLFKALQGIGFLVVSIIFLYFIGVFLGIISSWGNTHKSNELGQNISSEEMILKHDDISLSQPGRTKQTQNNQQIVSEPYIKQNPERKPSNDCIIEEPLTNENRGKDTAKGDKQPQGQNVKPTGMLPHKEELKLLGKNSNIPKSMPAILVSSAKHSEEDDLIQEKSDPRENSRNFILEQMGKFSKQSKSRQLFVAPRENIQMLKQTESGRDKGNNQGNNNNNYPINPPTQTTCASSIQVIEYEELSKLVKGNEDLKSKLKMLEKRQLNMISKLNAGKQGDMDSIEEENKGKIRDNNDNQSFDSDIQQNIRKSAPELNETQQENEENQWKFENKKDITEKQISQKENAAPAPVMRRKRQLNQVEIPQTPPSLAKIQDDSAKKIRLTSQRKLGLIKYADYHGKQIQQQPDLFSYQSGDNDDFKKPRNTSAFNSNSNSKFKSEVSQSSSSSPPSPGSSSNNNSDKSQDDEIQFNVGRRSRKEIIKR